MNCQRVNISLVVLIVVALGLIADPAPAQTNQKMTQMMQANASALKQYQWKSRTIVQKDGDTKTVQLDLVAFDSYGQMQRTRLSSSPEPDLPKFGLRRVIAQKKVKEFRDTVQDVSGVARSYSELTPDQMQRFVATATVSPEMTPQQKLLRVEGRSILQPGDSMTVWIDAISYRQRRVEVQTWFDAKQLLVSSDFQDIPAGGPTYLASSRVNYNSLELVILTENFEHARVRR